MNFYENVELELQPKSKIGVPPHLKKSALGVKLNKIDDYKLILPLSKLSEIKQKDNIEFYDIGSRLFKISQTKHDNDMIEIYRFTPIFSMKNCLPFQIGFQMLNENDIFIEKILNPQEVFTITDLKAPTFKSIKFRVYGSQWSEKKCLFHNCFIEKYVYGEIARKTKIELIDTKTKRTQVVNLLEKLQLEFFLYCDSVVIDETNMDLLLFSTSNLKTNEAFLISGQTNEPAETLIKPTALLMNDQEKIVIAKKGYLDNNTSPLSVDQDTYTKQTIKITKPDPFILDFGVKVKSLNLI